MEKMIFKQLSLDEGNIITEVFLVIYLDCDITADNKIKLIAVIQQELEDQCNNMFYKSSALFPEYREYKFNESELNNILSSKGYYLGSDAPGEMDDIILVMIISLDNHEDEDGNSYEEYLSLI
jgi:hypothetical protein